MDGTDEQHLTAPQLVDVDVQQLAGPALVVAAHRLARLEPGEPAEPDALEHGGDGRP